MKNFSRSATEQEQKALQLLQSLMPASRLFAEKMWRQAPKPFLISTEFQQTLEKLGHRLHQFNQACDLLYAQSIKGKQPSWIAALLDQGKPSELIQLGREKIFRGQTAHVIRPDLILTDDGFVICELDQIPGGIGLTAWLQEAYTKLGYELLGGSNGMLEGFYSIFPSGDIVLSEEAGTYRPEMKYLLERLHQLFHTQASKENWRLLDSNYKGTWTPLVYRFFELFDLSNIACSSELFASALKGDVTITPPPKPQLEEKLWFALFWMKPLQNFWRRELSERGFEQLKKVIPYTWILDPSPLPPHAAYPRLEVQSWNEVAAFSQQERELVIKISGFDERAWGSRGVVVGADVSKQEWETSLQNALGEYQKHPHILQIFHRSALHSHSYFTGPNEVSEMKGRVRLTPYYFVNGEKVTLNGALATICPADKKILHGMKDAILVPVQESGAVKSEE